MLILINRVFCSELVETLASSKRLNGLLIFDVKGAESDDSSAYTEDHPSPNLRSGIVSPSALRNRFFLIHDRQFSKDGLFF